MLNLSIAVSGRDLEFGVLSHACLLSCKSGLDLTLTLEIIHARHKRASTFFCSQFAPAGWYSKFPEATIADAILDRIVHDFYTIEIRGADDSNQKSMREVYGVGSK